jgi:hypothetical protein
MFSDQQNQHSKDSASSTFRAFERLFLESFPTDEDRFWEIFGFEKLLVSRIRNQKIF